jgi:hypothetical protein
MEPLPLNNLSIQLPTHDGVWSMMSESPFTLHTSHLHPHTVRLYNPNDKRDAYRLEECRNAETCRRARKMSRIGLFFMIKCDRRI